MYEEHGPIAHAASAMLVARRAYYILLSSMNRLCTERNLLPEVPQIITDAMADKALEPFDPTNIQTQVVDVLLKHLEFENQVRTALRIHSNREAAKAEEQERRSQDIPVPFPVLTSDLTAGLPRETPLLISGAAPVVEFWGWMLRAHWARQEDAVKKLRVLHLSMSDRNELLSKEKKQLVSVGRNLWQQHAGSTKQFDKFVGDWLRRFHDERIDVLLVDDLAQFGGPYPGITGPFNKAASGMKVLRRWCEGNGCSLVAGIPLMTDRMPHDVAGSFPGGTEAFRTLALHAALATTYTLSATDDAMTRIRLGKFDLQIPTEKYKDLEHVDISSPVVGELLDQVVATRDALQAGAGVQAERDDQGGDQGSGADSGEADEVADGDGEGAAVHSRLVGSLSGVAEDRAGQICIGGAVGSDVNQGDDVG